MRQARVIAAALEKTAARRVVSSEAVDAYSAEIDGFLAQGTVPLFEDMDRILCQACDLFMLVSRCVANPDMGEPVGITEETAPRNSRRGGG